MIDLQYFKSYNNLSRASIIGIPSLKERSLVIPWISELLIFIFGLILINSCIALIGSKLILPNPVALTVPPFSTSFFNLEEFDFNLIINYRSKKKHFVETKAKKFIN